TNGKAGKPFAGGLPMETPIDTIYSTVNAGGARGFNEATVAVQLKPSDERSVTTAASMEPFRKRLASIAGLEVSIGQNTGMGSSEKPLQLSVLGDGEAELRRISTEITTALAAIPGATEVESSTENKRPTLAVRIRHESASDLDVSIAAIGDTLRPLVAGDAISVWNAPDGETYDVVVRLPATGRRDAAQLRDLTIATGRTDEDGKPITVLLDQVADVIESTAPDAITRKDLSREIRIKSNIEGRALGGGGTPRASLWVGELRSGGTRWGSGTFERQPSSCIGSSLSSRESGPPHRLSSQCSSVGGRSSPLEH
ncbi:MAG: hypothetical protein DI537_62550, partial [Stutzerimonas stutzeri]